MASEEVEQGTKVSGGEGDGQAPGLWPISPSTCASVSLGEIVFELLPPLTVLEGIKSLRSDNITSKGIIDVIDSFN